MAFRKKIIKPTHQRGDECIFARPVLTVWGIVQAGERGIFVEQRWDDLSICTKIDGVWQTVHVGLTDVQWTGKPYSE